MTRAQRVCKALDLEPEVLADLFKREAARLLRVEAQLFDQHWSSAREDGVNDALQWVRLAALFEEEYDRQAEAAGERAAAVFDQFASGRDSGGGPAVGGESLRTDHAAASPLEGSEDRAAP